MITQLLSAGAALLWALCVTLRSLVGTLGTVRIVRPSWPPQPPRGVEYRTIRKIGPRLVAVRLQLVIA